jgi:swainsonine biosynthesis oxidoreductase SwnR
VLSILNSTGASALISTIRCPDSKYLPLHQGFLNACKRSDKCKRFIPSEWAGNIEDYPNLPGFYGKTRTPFREILKRSQGVEWTLFCLGWFTDYFVGEDKSYMKHLPGEFPIIHKKWEYVVRGTGDEPQSWTSGRDVGKAVAELLAAEEWVSPPPL